MNMYNANSVDLSKYDNVFCDSLQALEWAYQNGLPRSATIKSSAPALLWDKNPNIQNIEARWTISEVEKFQSTIQKYTENIFDAILNIDGIERELALTVSLSFYQFQSFLYKAACLKEDDFTNTRMLIYVDGKTGPSGNIMNSPWSQLLSSNLSLTKVNYTLVNDDWKMLTTKGVSYWKRFMVAGYETIIYRLAIKIMNCLPDWMFSKELLMPNENELNIEIASSLALRGVKISRIQSKPASNVDNIVLDKDFVEIYDKILPIMRKRVERWVVPSAVEVTISLFKLHLEKQLKQFKLLANEWEKSIGKSHIKKQSVLANSPGNIKGHALSYICRKKNIPLISSQHGVTVEISKAHSMLHVGLDNSVADIMFSYNSKIVEVEKHTYFNFSKHYSVGMPLRLMRMKYTRKTNKLTIPIVYISTNLYNMGFSLSKKTDYIMARDEQKVIVKVLNELPYKVHYKTYPEDNRRYSDADPVLRDVKDSDNVELFSEKIDMRYIISEYRIFVTTCATSTLSWPVMSGKPVVFINQKNNNPLTNESNASLSKGLFVFDSDEDDFHRNLRDFLSQPLEEIERLWKEKKVAREKMIKNYFSAYNGGAGERAAKIILKECF